MKKTELIKYIGMLEERIQTLKKFEIKDKKKKQELKNFYFFMVDLW